MNTKITEENKKETILPVPVDLFLKELITSTDPVHYDETSSVFANIMIECTKLQEAFDNVT